MNKIFKRFISLVIIFVLSITNFNFGLSLLGNNFAFAEENQVTVSDAIDGLIYYFENDYFKSKRGEIILSQQMGLQKAGVDLKKKNWVIQDKFLRDDNERVFILLQLGKDPSKYNGIRNLVKPIKESLDQAISKKYIQLKDLKAAIALDKFNEKFPNKKLEYDYEQLVNCLISRQSSEGNILSDYLSTAYAINILSKHSEIDGAKDAMDKAINYLSSNVKKDGGLYNGEYNGGEHSELICNLVSAKVDLRDEKWSNGGKSPIEALLKAWGGKKFDTATLGGNQKTITGKILYALCVLADNGYEDYILRDVKFDTVVKEKKSCKVKVAVAYYEDNKDLQIKVEPKEINVTSSNILPIVTVLDVVKTITKDVTVNNNSIEQLFGLSNDENNSWKYTINGEVYDVELGKKSIKDGDEIVCFYKKDDEDKIPTYTEIINKLNTHKEVAVEKLTLSKDNIELEEGATEALKTIITPEDATNTNLLYKTDNDKVATVDKSGLIKAVKEGQAKITVTTEDGKKEVSCNVVVKAKKVEKPAIPVTEEKIRVRVEGLKDTLYDKTVNFKDEVYVKDIIKSSIGEKNLEGLDKNFISKIFNENQTSSMGWMYYLVDKDGNKLQGDIINTQKIKDSDGNYYKEIIWHLSKWTGGITCIPEINIKNTGNNYIVEIKEQNKILGIEPRAAKNVTVKVDGIGEYKTNEEGIVKFKLTEGEHKVYIYKNEKDSSGNEYPAIVRQVITLVGKEDKDDNKIIEVINELKAYYSSKDLDYSNVLAFNLLNEKSKDTFKIKDTKNVTNCANNIMGIIAIGKNPYDYEKVNYVEKLLSAKDEDGNFVIGKMDKKSPTALSEAIIALDMASAKYDVEKSVNALMDFKKEKKIDDIPSISKAIIALSKHRNINGVNDFIKELVNELKNNQLENGGFKYYTFKNSPYSTALVIEALISIGEDPKSDSWVKDGKNPVEALLNCKVKNKGFEMAEGKGAGNDDPLATNLSFLAIAQYYKNQSVYDYFKYNKDNKDANVKDYNQIIESQLNDIKSYFKNVNELDFNMSLGLRYLGYNKETLSKQVKFKDNDGIGNLAQNIISIIAMDKNPRNYNGKNYVDTLSKKINDNSGYVLPKDYMYSLIALNMASADKNTIDSFISKIKTFYAGGNFGDVCDTSLAITALSPYKADREISEIIKQCINYLKNEQLNNGGFSLDKDAYENGDSEDIALAIEAIVASGQDPLSKDWCKNGKNPLDALLSFKMGNGYIYESSLGAYEQDMYTSKALRAIIALKEKATLFTKYKIEYNPAKDNTKVIKETLDLLKAYYKSKDKFEFREALALNYSSNNIKEDIKIIDKKYEVRKDCTSINDYSANIMGLIASGKDPRKFNSINYVEKLKNSQQKNGKFVISKNDEFYPTAQAYAILALDMANEEYNKEAAVKALCEMSSKGIYMDIDTTAMVITALAPYENIPQAKEVLKASIEHLKKSQNAEGGYDAFNQKNNPCTIATVIQALVANNINPLSENWTKNGKTMLDAILINKVDENFGNEFANSEVFMALADLYKENSMFRNLVFDDGRGIKPVLDQLKTYYSTKDKTYNYIQCLALKNCGFSSDILSKRIQLREEEPDFLNYDTDTTNLAKNIIAIKSAGLDPTNYKGKNYVDILLKSQGKTGEFRLKNEDKISIVSSAYAVLALDMCNVKYNSKVIDLLVNELEENSRSNIKVVYAVTMALSNHKDMDNVKNALKKSVDIVRELQCKDGNFKYSDRNDEKTCESISMAISTLIAAGEDVLSDKWKVDNKTMLDVLLSYKKSDSFKHDKIKEGYKEYTDEATGMAFAALLDVYNNKVIFNCNNKLEKEKEEVKEEVKVKEIEVLNTTKKEAFNSGKEEKVSLKVTNNNNNNKKVVLLVGLYDKDNKMVKCEILNSTIEGKSNKELEKTINIPNKGNYVVKSFLWDNIDDMNNLSDSIIIPVK